MKKFLIITSTSEKTVAWAQRETYLRQFCEQLEDGLTNVKVLFTTHADLIIGVINNQPQIFDRRNNLDLATVNLVHFKNWNYELEEAGLIAKYLNFLGVPFFNTEVVTNLALHKITQMVELAIAGLKVPDTLFAKKTVLREMIESKQLPTDLKFPLIIKANDGSRGDDNYCAKDSIQALRILDDPANKDKDFVLQEFIANDGDYRFLFIGLEDDPLIFKRTAVNGSHLNNTSKGGVGEFITPSQLPSEMVATARKAALILKREIGGTDIIVSKDTGKFYVLEVNGTPALATGFGPAEKAEKFIDFLKQNLETEEEE